MGIICEHTFQVQKSHFFAIALRLIIGTNAKILKNFDLKKNYGMIFEY